MIEIPESLVIAQLYSKVMEGRRIGKATGIGSMIEIELESEDSAAENYSFVAGDGAMFLIKPDDYDNPYYLVAKEKPMPGTEEFDYEYFMSLREDVSGKLSMKAFLATEQRIPGLGNGVLQDILLETGLHPKTKISTLRETDWRRVYEAVTGVLQKIKEQGGRDTEKTLFGVSGGYRTKLSKKTVGKGCCYCGDIVQKMSYLGGTVYYCPTCQR